MVEELITRIRKLKKEKGALILVHNYQPPQIQEIADFIGDSLGLSLVASKTKAKVIVFCGVRFMAETAKILSPQKIVLLPDKYAGCPLAEMITVKKLLQLRKRNPSFKIVSYVNTSAEIKAYSDYCCTSANAVKLINRIIKDKKNLIFVPDKYLGKYVELKIKKRLLLWNGYCPVHIKIKPEDIKKKKKLYPDAEILVHPECMPSVIKLADKVLSTEGMCKYIRSSKAKRFIVGTEIGIINRLKKENPDKEFFPANEKAICIDMKRITLRKVLLALERMQYQIDLPKDIILRARRSIKRMLDFTD